MYAILNEKVKLKIIKHWQIISSLFELLHKGVTIPQMPGYAQLADIQLKEGAHFSKNIVYKQMLSVRLFTCNG